MKFQLVFRVCLIFYTILPNFKSIKNNTMKNTAAATLAYLLQDVLNRRLLFKQTGNVSTKAITHHFFISGIGQKKGY